MTIADAHNDALHPIISQIVKSQMEAGGDFASILVLLESVVAGTILVLGKMHDAKDEFYDASVDAIYTGLKKRIAELRLAESKAAGSS